MRIRRLLSGVAALGVAGSLAGALASTAATASPSAAAAGCALGKNGNPTKHVIYLQFDNVHFTRDNPSVPSDLEQMPHLLNFLTSNGTLDDNHHTPLIAHTGTDILTSLTGMYASHMGQPISNSYRYYKPDGTSAAAGTFAYWTDGVYDFSGNTTNTAPTMTTQDGKIAPAPWAAYTKAGCDFGAVAPANTVLENNKIDLPKVFGDGSPEVIEGKTNPALATTDFVGIGIHCAKTSKACAKGHTRPDQLPDEPGGYNGFKGLFGAKYVDPQISKTGMVSGISGKTITDDKGNPGFPGFDAMSADNSLGYVAAMQEAGVPVTFAYISDAHDRHGAQSGAYGPGEAGYVAALKSYDDAFAGFFARLKKDGINQSNTLFVVTSDENDHFVGGTPAPAKCDGLHTPCTYSQIGEINANVTGLLATQQKVTTPFGIHADAAPNFWLTGNPARDAQVTRNFEHAVSNLTAANPITGKTDQFARYFADPVEMNLLHMVTGDPLRTPTLTSFANPDYYVYGGAPNCNNPCVSEQAAYAWNHGDFSNDVNRTWLGVVSPEAKHLGVTGAVWSDHTDIRPTMLGLLGLSDPYSHDGRSLFELYKQVPNGLRGKEVRHMAETFKQLNASVGAFGSATIADSTKGILSTSPGDKAYADSEARLQQLGTARDVVAGKMITLLEDAQFHDGHVDAREAKTLDEAGQAIIWLAQHGDRPLTLPAAAVS